MIALPPFRTEVLEPPEGLGVESLAAEGITLRLRVKTLAGRQGALERALRDSIQEALHLHGVEPPSPAMTIHVRPPGALEGPSGTAAPS